MLSVKILTCAGNENFQIPFVKTKPQMGEIFRNPPRILPIVNTYQ